MGKSIRSKRMRRNRNVKRTRYGPKETEKLKAALAFEYTEKTEKAHLSLFHDIMNGPPPPVPGLEPGSKIEKAHLTEGNVSVERIDNFMVGKMHRLVDAATRAITKGAKRKDEEEKDDTVEKMDDKIPRVYDKKTLKDQFGNYPVWMNRKKIQSKARAARLVKSKLKRAGKRRQGKVVSKSNDVEMESNSDQSDVSDMEL